MGHSAKHYVMIGVDLKGLDVPEEIEDDYFHSDVERFTITSDCNGDCHVLGAVLAKGTEEDAGLPFMALRPSELADKCAAISAELLQRGFEDRIPGLRGRPVQLFIFTEWG